MLHQQLVHLGMRQPAIALKIETRLGFRNPPDMLLTAMRAPSPSSVGFERLAEVQEKSLGSVEATMCPLSWPRRALENLAEKACRRALKSPMRAMGHRAECVMLNKEPPYLLSAVKTLDDILRRIANAFRRRSGRCFGSYGWPIHHQLDVKEWDTKIAIFVLSGGSIDSRDRSEAIWCH